MLIWRRRRKPSQETEQTAERLTQAREDLAAAQADDDTVDLVARRMAELRRRNHFGPMITEALRGSK